MKKYYLLTALIVLLGAISLKLNAQVGIKVIAAKEPRGLVFNGNDLYIAEFSAGKIFKIDVTANPVTRTEVFAGLNSPHNLLINNNALYVITGEARDDIYKIDLTTKAKTHIVKGGGISGMDILGNDLYFSENIGKKISKINLTTKLKTDFYSPVSALGIAFNGDQNYLYYAGSRAIFKINVKVPSLTTKIEVIPEGYGRRAYDQPIELMFNGTNLYSLESQTGDIFIIGNTKGYTPYNKINIAEMSIITRQPMAIAQKGKWLYVAEFKGNQISKINVVSDLNVSRQGNTLTASESGGIYQWLDCNDNNKQIKGATSQSYTPTKNGRYSVMATTRGCNGVSPCTEISTLGIIESTFSTQVKIYPNPISDKLTIELGKEYSKLNIEITNILGQVILSQKVSTTNNKVVLPLAASAGVYFVRLSSKEGTASFKVIKE